MSKENRLRFLQMSVSRNHGVDIFFAKRDNCSLEIPDKCLGSFYFFAQKQPKIGCNLIVSAATSVKLIACFTDQLDQASLHKTVYVFGRVLIEIRFIALTVFQNGFQTLDY